MKYNDIYCSDAQLNKDIIAEMQFQQVLGLLLLLHDQVNAPIDTSHQRYAIESTLSYLRMVMRGNTHVSERIIDDQDLMNIMDAAEARVMEVPNTASETIKKLLKEL